MEALPEPMPPAFVVGSDRCLATDVRDVLRRLGRGPGSGRSLGLEQGRALFSAMLDRRIDELELGGLLIALRMRGEAVDEVEGALQAVQARVDGIAVDPARPVVSIASYGGGRRSPNLTPLLACLLADAGLQVIVHGPRAVPGRTTSAGVFRAMGFEPAQSAADASFALELGNPAFVPVDILCPEFASLLALRERLGVRHIGHALASLIDPTRSAPTALASGLTCVRIASFTHPAFARLQREVLGRIAGRAILQRGFDGEPVTNPRRLPRAEWIDGPSVCLLASAGEQALRRREPLPPAEDPVATAAWILSTLAGEQPVPHGIRAQVDLIVDALAR